MIVSYTPCGTKSPAIWTQPSPDVLACEWRGKLYECDFSDPGVEYEIPDEVRDVVHKAWRETEDGPLHLQVPSLRSLGQEVTIDHETDEVLGW
jgi:hypothetical protein